MKPMAATTLVALLLAGVTGCTSPASSAKEFIADAQRVGASDQLHEVTIHLGEGGRPYTSLSTFEPDGLISWSGGRDSIRRTPVRLTQVATEQSLPAAQLDLRGLESRLPTSGQRAGCSATLTVMPDHRQLHTLRCPGDRSRAWLDGQEFVLGADPEQGIVRLKELQQAFFPGDSISDLSYNAEPDGRSLSLVGGRQRQTPSGGSCYLNIRATDSAESVPLDVGCRTETDLAVPAESVQPAVAARLIRDAGGTVILQTQTLPHGGFFWIRHSGAASTVFDENGLEVPR